MPSLSPAERQLIEIASDAPMLDQVLRWAAVNSGSANLEGLDTIANMLGDAFAVLPGALDLVDAQPVEHMTADGRIEAIPHGRHLRLSVRPAASLRLLLTGHMDTVFASDHPFQHCVWREDDILNGPGVADMKGGLAVMLAALTALENTPDAARFGYDVIINSDEEVGSQSSRELLAAHASGKLAALTYEPALPDGTLAGARPGSGNFSILISGRSAHAGRNPQDGRNALVAAADLAVRLKAAATADLPVNPARIDGGGPNNVVPSQAILRVNLRPGTPAAETEAAALLRRCCDAIAREHDVGVHIHGGFNRPPKALDAPALALFGLVRQAGADLGLALDWKATGGVCDGNNIAACGVPVIDTMGPRGGAIHSPDEFLIASSLAERAALSALAIHRIIDRGTL